jgi:hypothetical protein
MVVLPPFFPRFFRVILIGSISMIDTIDVMVERTSRSDIFLSFVSLFDISLLSLTFGPNFFSAEVGGSRRL